MLIGIDASKFATDKKTGVENMACQLILNLLKIDRVNHYLLYSAKKIPAEFIGRNSSERLIPFPKFWHKFRLPLALLKDKPDAFIELTYRLPSYCPKKSVVYIHDLAFKIFPKVYSKYELLLQENAIKSDIAKASKMLFSSQANVADFNKYYQCSKDKLAVVPLAYNDEVFRLPKTKVQKQPYFLFVGRFEKRKNIDNIIKAFSKFSKQFPQYKLIMIGKPGYGWKDTEKLIATENLTRKVKIVGFVKNEQLATYYQKATALIYPSFYEGFGFPILEAMACGTAVVSSNIPTIKDVFKDSILYVAPSNVDEIVSAMAKITSDNKCREQLVENGLKFVRDYSWQKSAEKLLNIVNNL